MHDLEIPAFVPVPKDGVPESEDELVQFCYAPHDAFVQYLRTNLGYVLAKCGFTLDSLYVHESGLQIRLYIHHMLTGDLPVLLCKTQTFSKDSYKELLYEIVQKMRDLLEQNTAFNMRFPMQCAQSADAFASEFQLALENFLSERRVKNCKSSPHDSQAPNSFTQIEVPLSAIDIVRDSGFLKDADLRDGRVFVVPTSLQLHSAPHSSGQTVLERYREHGNTFGIDPQHITISSIRIPDYPFMTSNVQQLMEDTVCEGVCYQLKRYRKVGLYCHPDDPFVLYVINIPYKEIETENDADHTDSRAHNTPYPLDILKEEICDQLLGTEYNTSIVRFIEHEDDLPSGATHLTSFSHSSETNNGRISMQSLLLHNPHAHFLMCLSFQDPDEAEESDEVHIDVYWY